MDLYLTKQQAVWDLHEKGYVYDFLQYGKDLFWVQEKVLIHADGFSIKERHSFREGSKKTGNTVVSAVVALFHGVQGILISHEKDNNGTG
jgi:hypothetical protein